MFRRLGVMCSKIFATIMVVFPLIYIPQTIAISVGNLTFSLPSDKEFVAKRVLNNNKSARLYQVSITAIDSPSSHEVRSRTGDGELLFAPRQLVLQAGQSEYYKFYYHGPKDGRERYYRVSFKEMPPQSRSMANKAGSISMEPIVILDTIMVVRPRKVNFKWSYDPVAGSVSNQGNTWFKLLIKPGCQSSEEEGDAWYLRPGETLRQPLLRQKGNHYIVYNDKFIPISSSCPKEPDKLSAIQS